MSHLIKVFKLFTYKEKYKFFFIFIFSILAAILELFGIALMIPILTILLKGNLDNQDLVFLNFDLNSFKGFFAGDILFIGLFFLIIVYVLKNIFLIGFNFYNNKYTNNVSARISKDIFFNYLKRNFDFHLENNSSELIKNCIYLVYKFRDTLNHFIIAISELVVLIGIALLLIVVEPKGFLLSFTFLILISLFIFITTNKINMKWGEKINILEKERYLHLTQAFSGIREIKVFKKINFFFNRYIVPNKENFKISYLHASLSALPKYIIEVFFILTLTLLLVFFKLSDKTNYEIILILGLFAVASIRIMPSLNRILTSYQRIKFGYAAIDILYDVLNNFKLPSINNNKASNFDINKNYLIKLENIFYKYNSAKTYILRDINFTIKKNEFIGVIGETGSGKSTLINLILGLLKPAKGNLYFNYTKVSFVPQSPYLIDDTILSNVALGVEENKINTDRANKCLEEVQLKKFVDSLPRGINSNVGEKGVRISGGELQRLAIARALYIKPDVIIFDEPTTSLDKVTEEKIMNIIKVLSQTISVVFVTHDPNHLKYCDQVIKLENNKNHLVKKNESNLTKLK